ncbi:MAG: hypothetical protein ACJ75B_19645 [Flavisolibacter sp.]
MEMRRENQNDKRKRKIISRRPVLVRSAKPGQLSVPCWQRESGSLAGLWRA